MCACELPGPFPPCAGENDLGMSIQTVSSICCLDVGQRVIGRGCLGGLCVLLVGVLTRYPNVNSALSLGIDGGV